MTNFEKVWCKSVSFEISDIIRRLEAKSNRSNDDDYYNSYRYQNASKTKRIDDLRELDLLVDIYTKLKSLENDNDESQ